MDEKVDDLIERIEELEEWKQYDEEWKDAAENRIQSQELDVQTLKYEETWDRIRTHRLLSIRYVIPVVPNVRTANIVGSITYQQELDLAELANTFMTF